MTVQADHRDDFIATLDHLAIVAEKVAGALGPGGAFTFPDHHKLSEGLFLSAWTHWEEFIRLLLIDDLAEERNGFVRKDVRRFRVKGAPRRIAERILSHPDHPKRYVEWNFGVVKSRADNFLPTNHRFTAQLPRGTDLEKLKRMRNAIAHKSDNARSSFRNLVTQPPFLLTANQLKGLTVGRFLVSHDWNNNKVLNECFFVHREHALHLVP